MSARFLVVVVAGLSGCPTDAPVPAPTRFDTGTIPNSVALSRCGDERVALVTASGGARLNTLFIDRPAQPASSGVAFPSGSAPWLVVASDGEHDGAQALVTLQGGDALAGVDPCGGVLSTSLRPDVVVPVPPLTLRNALDADGDGDDETRVEAMLLRGPQGLAVVGERIFVTFTNIFEPASTGAGDMTAGPGALAVFHVDVDGQLAFDSQQLLPCDNPQAVVAARFDAADTAADAVVVSCTGRFAVVDGDIGRASDGGLVVVDATTLTVLHEARFAMSFGTPVVVDGAIVVGDVLDGVVRRFSAELVLLDEVRLGDGNESLFKVVVVDGLPAVTRFVAGDLVLDPFGAQTSISFVDDGPPRGLLDVAIDDERRQAVGLLTLSAELVIAVLP